MVTKAKMWLDVQETWWKEYDWLISAKYPNEILKFIALYECLLAYSKKEFFDFNTINDDILKVQKDPFAFHTGLKTFIENKPITDLNKSIFSLCCTLIRTCPQPFSDDSDFIYYDEIKKRVKQDYPDCLSSFPEHEYNRLNNPPLKKRGIPEEVEHIYIEHLPLLYGSSWSISQKPESLISSQVKKDYFKRYFTVLIHSRNWIYHNNKAGNTEPDKLVLKNHIEIMLFMIKNWKK